VLVGAAGFWLENDPIPDLFSADLDDLPAMLFHDPKSPLAQMMIAMPWEDQELLTAMYVERTRRFSAASKFLWPIPDRGLKKRAYRIAAPTLLLWGESDKVIPPVYAREFKKYIRNGRVHLIKEAGHMVMYEQPAEFDKVVTEFLKS
jgi:pimeloyl-ACP methyl ester carboxylesterase